MVSRPGVCVAARFSTVIEAELALSALDAAGIEGDIADANIVGIDWRMSQGVGGIKIVVAEEDLERAQEILGPESAVAGARGDMAETVEASEGELAAGALARGHGGSEPETVGVDALLPPPDDVCPECGSPDFRRLHRLRIFLVGSAVFIGIGAAVGQLQLGAIAVIAIALGVILMPGAQCQSCSYRWSPPPPEVRRAEAPMPDARDMVEEPCPRCGSMEVYRIAHRRLKTIPLLFSPSIVVVLPLWLFARKRRCDACGLVMR